jgi:hypothetical protein
VTQYICQNCGTAIRFSLHVSQGISFLLPFVFIAFTLPELAFSTLSTPSTAPAGGLPENFLQLVLLSFVPVWNAICPWRRVQSRD